MTGPPCRVMPAASCTGLAAPRYQLTTPPPLALGFTSPDSCACSSTCSSAPQAARANREDRTTKRAERMGEPRDLPRRTVGGFIRSRATKRVAFLESREKRLQMVWFSFFVLAEFPTL